jgi:OOP family OmpA-OmpF porin
LRALLLGPERIQLATLQQRLDDPAQRAEDVSRVLAAAISLSAARDSALGVAIGPTVEAALRSSVRTDPRPLVDALFPVMGPAIRRAIAATLTGMVEAFNRALEHSLSLRGLKWRVEAWRSGRPFAEVVLLHTLVYQVEQVFLIHRETGLLLAHAAIPGIDASDADVVAPMLTAIQDVARDCFQAGPGEGVDAFQVGSLSVWIEQAPLALLAAVIRGVPPAALRGDMQRTLEAIHGSQREALLAFDGDSAPLADADRELRACLQAQYVSPSTRRSGRLWPVTTVVAGFALALGVWGGVAIRDHRRWERYVERLRAEPGIVVMEAGRRGGRYLLRGLRDPLARDPAALLRSENLEPGQVIARWEPYHALRPEFILARARTVLGPPPTVALRLDDGTLALSGSARRAWITQARRLALVLPGITRVRDDGLVDSDLAALHRLQSTLEALVIRFVAGSTRLAPGQGDPIAIVGNGIQQLIDAARATGHRIGIEVVGHTDLAAPEQFNLTLSQRRAETIAGMLGGLATDVVDVSAVGVGFREPLQEERTEADRAFNRSVTFRITLRPAPP